MDYGTKESRFSEIKLADLGGAVSISSELALDDDTTGTSVFRAPEVHLKIPWRTAADVWGFGVTVSLL